MFNTDVHVGTRALDPMATASNLFDSADLPVNVQIETKKSVIITHPLDSIAIASNPVDSKPKKKSINVPTPDSIRGNGCCETADELSAGGVSPIVSAVATVVAFVGVTVLVFGQRRDCATRRRSRRGETRLQVSLPSL